MPWARSTSGSSAARAAGRCPATSSSDQRRCRAMLRDDFDVLAERFSDYTGPLKVSLAGPYTLLACVDLVRGEAMVSDAGARRELVQAHAAALGGPRPPAASARARRPAGRPARRAHARDGRRRRRQVGQRHPALRPRGRGGDRTRVPGAVRPRRPRRRLAARRPQLRAGAVADARRGRHRRGRGRRRSAGQHRRPRRARRRREATCGSASCPPGPGPRRCRSTRW